MSTGAALGLVLAGMAAVNVWVHVGPRRLQPVVGPLAAAALVLVARAAGLSWSQLGLGRQSLGRGAAAGAVAAGLVDMKNAQIPGAYRSWAHDYRPDLARFVSAVFDLPVSPEQLAAVEAALERRETAREELFTPRPPVAAG